MEEMGNPLRLNYSSGSPCPEQQTDDDCGHSSGRTVRQMEKLATRAPPLTSQREVKATATLQMSPSLQETTCSLFSSCYIASQMPPCFQHVRRNRHCSGICYMADSLKDGHSQPREERELGDESELSSAVPAKLARKSFSRINEQQDGAASLSWLLNVADIDPQTTKISSPHKAPGRSFAPIARICQF
ncbi:hypothetical protein GWK47_043439 [Chionoecetes opilio]|uniref:Uncharacterized protein n=1 Tax=Chionoecetes opilio TaxID=41210 RepID=A0A8J5CZL1_CHIOP|nr:hypothetical protein GWK47_043439 [Chionoecetes opilio]